MKLFIAGLNITLSLLATFIFIGSLRLGISPYTPLLIISSLIAFGLILWNYKIGRITSLIVSIIWLFRYSFNLCFLAYNNYDNSFVWTLVLIPAFIALIILISTLNELLIPIKSYLRFSLILITLALISIVGWVTYIYRPIEQEFNCWYEIYKGSNDYEITFALSPTSKFNVTSNSIKLKNIILKDGLYDEIRNGYYCPQTKVKLNNNQTIQILGFTNTQMKKYIRFDSPIIFKYTELNGFDEKFFTPYFMF